MGFASDAGGVPEKFTFFLGGVAPGRLAFLETFLDDALGFAEHDGDVFVGMEAVADEERDHDDVASGGHGVTVADAGIFLHEDRMDFGVFAAGADEFDLAFDRFAGVFIVAGAVAGDEERGFGRLGRARERMFLDDVASAGEQEFGHAFVGADRPAIKDLLREPVILANLNTIEAGCAVMREAEFARNDFLGEVTLTDEERDYKNALGEGTAKDGGDAGLLFP